MMKLPDPELSKFEKAALAMALAGEHPTLLALRRQLPYCRVAEREMTGCGFITTIEVDRLLVEPALEEYFLITDVFVNTAAVRDGIGLLLVIDDGYIAHLEGFTFGGEWPEAIEPCEFKYMNLNPDGSRNWLNKPPKWPS
ncbi:MAG: hypothetical protein JNJ88_12085 [Planctomycetes bacterium]|nr:hypothetical protein [Planctomycetota bacterium]